MSGENERKKGDEMARKAERMESAGANKNLAPARFLAPPPPVMLSRLKRNAREECWPNLILSSTVFSPFALFYLKIFNRERKST